MASGAFLLSLANALRLGLQMLMLPVLARILGPEAYGIMGLAMPFILFVNLFADAGLGGALVRETSPSKELVSTVFWTTMLLSVVLAVLLGAAAWPLAAALGRPEVAPVVASLTSLLILGGLNAVPTAQVVREERFSVLARADILSPLAGSACAIAAAFAGWGVWSLVVQQVVLWGVRLGLLWTAVKFKAGWTFKPRILGRLSVFGANSVGAGFMELASRNLDNVVVGAILGVTSLGHYSMAYQLVRMPEMLVVGPMYTALFPRTAQLADKPDEVSRVFLDSLRGMALICAPALAGLAVVSGPFTAVVLGEKWAPAAPVLMWLSPAGFVLCVMGLMTALLLGLGFSAIRLRLSTIFAATTLVGIVIGAQFSVVGVAIGLSAGSLVTLGFALDALTRHCRLKLGDMLRELQPIAIATLVMVVGVETIEFGIEGLSDKVTLALSILVGVIGYVGALTLFDRARLKRDVAVLTAVLQRRTA